MIDFGATEAGRDWAILNDGVMGGLSKGTVSFSENSFLFTGTVSLANNGGFTSFRSPFRKIDLSSYEKVQLRVRGHGQQFAIILESNRTWYIPYFKHAFNLKGKDWQVIELNLSDFLQYQIGSPTGRRLAREQQAEILRMGIMTNSKKEGPFQLEVDYLEFL